MKEGEHPRKTLVLMVLSLGCSWVKWLTLDSIHNKAPFSPYHMLHSYALSMPQDFQLGSGEILVSAHKSEHDDDDPLQTPRASAILSWTIAQYH